MDLPYAFVDSIAKMIPKELNITLDKSLKMNHELKKLYDEDPQVKELIDVKETGRSATAYIHACRGSRDQPEGCG